jgi:aminoglycoside phosphotransferase
MQPGWWTAARAWVESQLGAAEITQTRAWESSCVARCRSRAGVKHFFKAVPAAAAREVRVTAYLADHGFPGAPEVVAADLERRWLLMRAFEGDSLDDSRSPARWRRAAGVYGRLQAMSADAIGDLRSLGCLERRVLDVESAIGALLADEVSLLPAQPEGLSHEQIRETRRLEASWRRACRTLHESGMHEALDHGDLWPSNLLVDEAACTVIDWEDAGISHPFPSLAPFLAMHREWSVDVDVETLIDDYLTGLGGRAHRSLLRTTAPVGFLELALRYWRMPASVKELHPWMYETVPFFLRRAIWWSLEG